MFEPNSEILLSSNAPGALSGAYRNHICNVTDEFSFSLPAFSESYFTQDPGLTGVLFQKISGMGQIRRPMAFGSIGISPPRGSRRASGAPVPPPEVPLSPLCFIALPEAVRHFGMVSAARPLSGYGSSACPDGVIAHLPSADAFAPTWEST